MINVYIVLIMNLSVYFSLLLSLNILYCYDERGKINFLVWDNKFALYCILLKTNQCLLVIGKMRARLCISRPRVSGNCV